MRRRRRSRFAAHVPHSPWRRVGLALVAALVAVGFYFFGNRQVFRPAVDASPPVTMSVAQEVALGHRAARLLLQQPGGLDADTAGQVLVESIGARLVERSAVGQTPYPFTFQLLADPRVVDVFALPGGPVFLTAGMAARLRTEGEFAAVLAHAAAHVAARHAAAYLAQTHPPEDVPSADVIAGFDPADAPSSLAALVEEAAGMVYAPADEIQADTLALGFMAEAGYDPRALVGVIETLHRAAAGGNPPAFFNTHPNPDRRLDSILAALEKRYPEGVPEGLVK